MKTAVADSDLISLDRLFSAQSYDALQISPDGSMVSYIGPLDGVPNIFVAPVADMEAARPVTDHKGRGIQSRDVSGNVLYRWTACGKFLVYPRDRDGDERWQLYRIDVATGESLNLTPFDGARAELLVSSGKRPDEILVSIDDRQAGVGDLYRIDLLSGERTLVEENPGFVGYLADAELRPRVAAALGEAGRIALLKSSGDGDWAPLVEIPAKDVSAFLASIDQKIVRIDEKGEALFLYDSCDRDTAALVRIELESGQKTMIASDERVDIGGVLYHLTDGRPQAYATVWKRRRWNVLDEAIREDLDFLTGALDGDLDILSRSRDDGSWIVKYTLSHEPETFHLYDRSARTLRKLMTGTPELEGVEMAPMHPVVIPSRDGFDLVSYVTLPLGSDPDATGRPDKPVPLVLLVHGGPGDERAIYAYAPFLQWLSSRGYGSLYVNFRGSPGFGKRFMNAAVREWGGAMHDDLIDQVEWAIAEGITSRDRVAILGGSYGGYAALVGMTMTPDVFACGIDLVGPSSIEKPMPHWTEEGMAQSMGDPRTPEGRELLAARSPTNFADQIQHPILIGQGANDSRVPQDQSDQMVEIMTGQGAEVVYALYPDEGHGLNRHENNRSFWAIAEIFLARCLGGRYRPLADELEGSSLEVPVGVEHIPGLAEALERRTATVDSATK
ncbi:MAG TPA: S9 family peptidase [Myxococcales bacterium]|nr:S9 family peptidase [Myxococcales bacterium]